MPRGHQNWFFNVCRSGYFAVAATQSPNRAAFGKPMVGFARLCSCFGGGGVQTRDDEALPQQPGQQYHQEVVEPVKPSQKDNSNQGSRRQAVFYVKMASSDGTSSGGASSSGGAGSSDTLVTSSEPSDSVEDEAWFDCEEQTEWLNAQGEQDSSSIARDPTQHSAAVDQTAATLTPEQQACLKKLPSRLLGLLTKYLEGTHTGCKPLVALMHYMQDSNTSLQQLQDLLQPLLKAEQHLPERAPVPCPVMSPAERTALLRAQLRELKGTAGAAPAGSTSHSLDACSQQQQQQQQCRRLGHLLKNLQLAHDTLFIMEQHEGFRQVAWGALEMWYRHDVAASSQMILAKAVLNEPVSVVSAITREFDLVTSWNPGMGDMRELANFSPTEMFIYLLPWMPWPLPQPEMVNYCFGADLLDLQQRCILFHTSSAEAPAGIELPKHPRTMSMHMTVGGFRLVPLQPLPDQPDTPRTEVTVLVSIDATRFVVPDSIISCVLKVFAPLVHKSVLKVLTRMFHQAAKPAGSTATGSGGPSRPPSVCGTSLLVERLGLRPEYAALDVHATRVLTAAAAAAGAADNAGAAQPLDLATP